MEISDGIFASWIGIPFVDSDTDIHYYKLLYGLAFRIVHTDPDHSWIISRILRILHELHIKLQRQQQNPIKIDKPPIHKPDKKYIFLIGRCEKKRNYIKDQNNLMSAW